ncbi:hypothetical protein [uncultured Vagococcus sp.]|uniref:hypothetical protein n=1 Tax=uncultured Vagococcus sp. TaxID=189676 RepID=UPI0028D68A52|nr:hypothetical protein [uncultured Vagococcus sp.]
MSLLKSALKYKTAKKVTDKALGGGVLSTVAATKVVKRSNERSRSRRAGKK